MLKITISRKTGNICFRESTIGDTFAKIDYRTKARLIYQQSGGEDKSLNGTLIRDAAELARAIVKDIVSDVQFFIMGKEIDRMEKRLYAALVEEIVKCCEKRRRAVYGR